MTCCCLTWVQNTGSTADWVAIGGGPVPGLGDHVEDVGKRWSTTTARGVVTNDYPLTPLFIPKIVVSIGFTLLCVTAIHMMYMMVAESLVTQCEPRFRAARKSRIWKSLAGEAAGAAD